MKAFFAATALLLSFGTTLFTCKQPADTTPDNAAVESAAESVSDDIKADSAEVVLNIMIKVKPDGSRHRIGLPPYFTMPTGTGDIPSESWTTDGTLHWKCTDASGNLLVKVRGWETAEAPQRICISVIATVPFELRHTRPQQDAFVFKTCNRIYDSSTAYEPGVYSFLMLPGPAREYSR